MTFSASSASASDVSLTLSMMDEERESNPMEDRERIIQLGIAVTWIAQERVSDTNRQNYVRVFNTISVHKFLACWVIYLTKKGNN